MVCEGVVAELAVQKQNTPVHQSVRPVQRGVPSSSPNRPEPRSQAPARARRLLQHYCACSIGCRRGVAILSAARIPFLGVDALAWGLLPTLLKVPLTI